MPKPKQMQIDGKPVTDPRRKIVLTITPEDVATGRKKAPDSCAAAKACVRQLGAISARVHASRVYIEFAKRWDRFHTPIALRTEIVSFDRGHKFETGEYTLSPMQPSHRGTGKRHGTNKPTKRAKKRSKPHAVQGIRSHFAGFTQAA